MADAWRFVDKTGKYSLVYNYFSYIYTCEAGLFFSTPRNDLKLTCTTRLICNKIILISKEDKEILHLHNSKKSKRKQTTLNKTQQV